MYRADASQKVDIIAEKDSWYEHILYVYILYHCSPDSYTAVNYLPGYVEYGTTAVLGNLSANGNSVDVSASRG